MNRFPDKPRDVARPGADEISGFTDQYFLVSKKIVERFGDRAVTYAVFMRQPICFAPRLMVSWLDGIAATRGFRVDIEPLYHEGEQVKTSKPLVMISGPLAQLIDLETLFLQKLGPACIAAHNAFTMCATLPRVAFLAMDARHCAGTEMAEAMAYAASVGSNAAKKSAGAKGFIGNANDATAHYFGNRCGLGTMPHALIGYAGSTLRAAEMFVDRFPDRNLTVLVDYFGQEISDSLIVCRNFREYAESGRLAVRVDTDDCRFVEGLDERASLDILHRHGVGDLPSLCEETQCNWLIGRGVSAAAILHLRDRLDESGFDQVKIVASSGFNVGKCHTMAQANAPIDIVGTGSYLPAKWSDTYATADIIAYDGTPRVKRGREFLLSEASRREK